MEPFFLYHHAQDKLTEDFDTIDEAEIVIASALRALEEQKLSLQPSNEKNTVPVRLAA